VRLRSDDGLHMVDLDILREMGFMLHSCLLTAIAVHYPDEIRANIASNSKLNVNVRRNLCVSFCLLLDC
jgi:hypothetical protein